MKCGRFRKPRTRPSSRSRKVARLTRRAARIYGRPQDLEWPSTKRSDPSCSRPARSRPSHRSGHPYAAAASWGLLPPVIALYTRRAGIWWATVVAAWGTITAIAASRIWLGVDWVFDALGGVLLACLG